MSRPEFLADHDLNEQIVAGVLRRVPTVEYIRVRDIGSVDRPDAEVLEYAANRELIVVSHDVNTMPMQAYDRIAAGQAMAGLLMVQQSDPVGAIIESLVMIALSSDGAEWRGQVLYLPL